MTEHGTRYCYRMGCRLPECRAANAAYHRRLRAARLAKLDPDTGEGKVPLHGLRSNYVNGSCRCEECEDANRVYARDQKRKRAGLRRNPNGAIVPFVPDSR